ncbi:MAG: homoserine O-acetyltransferase MetX [Planctomycetota bacterium]|jgi:homoserine O-acetyltransferase
MPEDDASLTEGFFASSDAIRSARPLKYAQTVTFTEPLDLALGGRLPSVTVTYETLGRLSKERDNAVFICHALSGDSHVARHDEDDDPGWWDVVVGPGKPIDTDKFFVICPNILGGCRGTTGPNSDNPATKRPYGMDFPTITTGDMVQLHLRLLRHLGIEKVLAAVGGSMGGFQALHWAARFPEMLEGVIPIAASARLSSQALAFDVVGRNAILRDPNFCEGRYYARQRVPNVGLAIARMIGHITYLSRESMQEKFEADRLEPRNVPVEFEKKFSVGSYLGYQGAKFVERFDANSYLLLSMAMDLFDLGGSVEELARVFERSDCRWLIISYTSDWLFPPSEQQQIVDALVSTNKQVSYCNVESSCGHDAMLLPNDLDVYGELIRAFLLNLSGEKTARRTTRRGDHGPTSVFQTHRLDLDRIMELIPASASVLDLGCGNGLLMARLRDRNESPVTGLELSQDAIVECVRQGLDVIQADLNKGLPEFADRQFDYVVLSQTLQAVRDVERLMDELLRVGKRCIVTFPNFGYHKLRTMLAEGGRAPETAGILRYKWYNSPNIRFFTIADFEDFCAAKGINVHKRITLDTEAGREVRQAPNVNADLAIFVISR